MRHVELENAVAVDLAPRLPQIRREPSFGETFRIRLLQPGQHHPHAAMIPCHLCQLGIDLQRVDGRRHLVGEEPYIDLVKEVGVVVTPEPPLPWAGEHDGIAKLTVVATGTLRPREVLDGRRDRSVVAPHVVGEVRAAPGDRTGQ